MVVLHGFRDLDIPGLVRFQWQIEWKQSDREADKSWMDQLIMNPNLNKSFYDINILNTTMHKLYNDSSSSNST